MTSSGGDIVARAATIAAEGNVIWSVRVGFAAARGSVRSLRVHSTYYTTSERSFRGAEAREIVDALRRPGQFAFEWARSADHSKRQGLFGTGDFAARARDCETWLGPLGA